MATELVIKSWCDECLAGDVNTPGETVTINVTGTPAFDLELCPEHGAPLAAAVARLAAYGRSPGKTVPTTPTRAARGAGGTVRGTQAPGTGGTCPECAFASKTRASLRTHLRNVHDKSLADVGLAVARFSCPECGAKFDAGQGLASHVRAAHGAGAKQSA